MIGYFPALQPGELLYSAIARAAALHFPRKSPRWAVEHILGHRWASFGGLLPINGARLLANVPVVAGLDEQAIIDGSLYHLMSPFLPADERGMLKQSLMKANVLGKNWFKRYRPDLRYCVACAKEDADLDRPPIWRVVPNHPVVSCCHIHGIQLVETSAYCSCPTLHDPKDWISVESKPIHKATEAELCIARDANWLYTQKSRYLPGYAAVSAATRVLLLRNRAFAIGRRHLDRRAIAEYAKQRFGDTIDRVDRSFYKDALGKALVSECSRASLQRYSLLAHLAGASMSELINTATVNAQPIIVSPVHWVPETLLQAKRELLEFIEQNPGIGRRRILRTCPNAADIVFRMDRSYYEKVMPPRTRAGGHKRVCWPTRDMRLSQQIRNNAQQLGEAANSVERIFAFCGLSPNALWKSHRKLPLARAAAFEVRTAWRLQRRAHGSGA